MKTKKYSFNLISVILVAVLVVSTFTMSIVSALEEGTIKISNNAGKVGDTVDVTFAINNNPGLIGMALNVTFDDSALQLIAVSDGGILGTNAHKPELENPYTLSWSNDTMRTNITNNGTIVTLSFLIKKRAVKGNNYEIKANYDYDNYDIYDVDSNPVKFNIIDGYINVINDILEPTDAPTTAESTTIEPTEELTTVESTTVESTEEPTTVEYTTIEPTEEPTTVEYTTIEPTEEPTTAEPTTVESTEEPTTAEPTTAEPTTVEPTEELSTAEPTTVESTETPTTVEPTTIESNTSLPTTVIDDSNPTVSPNIEMTTERNTTNLTSTIDNSSNSKKDEVKSNSLTSQNDNGIVKTGDLFMGIIIFAIMVSLTVIAYFVRKFVKE